MKASDLRIGNYLQYHDGINFIVTHHDIKIIAEWTSKIAPLPNPIPLTEEWLIKLGFTIWNEYSPILITYELDSFQIDYEGDGFVYWKQSGLDDIQLNYVHQLQNLYYALTNEELKTND